MKSYFPTHLVALDINDKSDVIFEHLINNFLSIDSLTTITMKLEPQPRER